MSVAPAFDAAAFLEMLSGHREETAGACLLRVFEQVTGDDLASVLCRVALLEELAAIRETVVKEKEATAIREQPARQALSLREQAALAKLLGGDV
jgi:hypothetical protein